MWIYSFIIIITVSQMFKVKTKMVQHCHSNGNIIFYLFEGTEVILDSFAPSNPNLFSSGSAPKVLTSVCHISGSLKLQKLQFYKPKGLFTNSFKYNVSNLASTSIRMAFLYPVRSDLSRLFCQFHCHSFRLFS